MSWKVTIYGASCRSFMWGLNANHSYAGGLISHLELRNVPANILTDIVHLDLDKEAHLVKAIPHNMKNLSSLAVPCTSGEVLEQIAHSNVVTLVISDFKDTSLRSLESLWNLINSSSKKLVNLTISYNPKLGKNLLVPEPLCDVLFSSSSLSYLQRHHYTYLSLIDALHLYTYGESYLFQPCLRYWLRTEQFRYWSVNHVEWTARKWKILMQHSSNLTLQVVTLHVSEKVAKDPHHKLKHDSRVFVHPSFIEYFWP